METRILEFLSGYQRATSAISLAIVNGETPNWQGKPYRGGNLGTWGHDLARRSDTSGPVEATARIP